ncbi:glycosyltransferase [Flavimarina sp. Hel_I_48]|uniref:glycosyltransferase n=1 Tax=Flavimarina sp. Hel_I_48 TaxID=1392488 RepID=UPI0004DF0B59|nr:glycosyltransferase [Flavimarina sp. Hel_I_48]
MTLSIIIPVYNSEKFIERAVASLMRQNLNEDQFEILLVNDGSKDDSLKICKHLEHNHTNIHAYTKENGGTGDTRNFGLDRASGKYIYFLDVDDYLADDTLPKVLKNLEENELDIITFQSIKTTSIDRNKSQPINPIEGNSNVMDGICYLAKNSFDFEVWRFITNRKFLIKTDLRFESDRLLEDAYFTIRLYMAARRAMKLPLDVHRYVQESTSALHRTGEEQNNRIINDLVVIASQYENLINEYKNIDHICKSGFLEVLERKKQFFIYYSVVRAYSGNVPFERVWSMLQQMKKIDAYPFDKIETMDDPLAKKLQYIFNRKALLYILFNGFRPVLNLKKKLRG